MSLPTVPISILLLTGIIFTCRSTCQEKKKGNNLPAGVEVIKDIPYVEGGSDRQKLDLYLPENRDPEKPLPVVMWVHGGGWAKGSKDKCPAVDLCPRGFAIASVGYRLTDEAQWPSQINDLYSAVRWLRENADKYNIDGKHIGAWGGSAGGHLVALLGTRPYPGDEKTSSRVQAVCDWYGPTDLLTMPPNVVSKTRTLEQVRSSNGAKLLGRTVHSVPALAKDASALYKVSEDDPPFLIMHGSDDPGVPLEQSIRFHRQLQTQGIPADLVVVQGAGHGGELFRTEELFKQIEEFFTKYLKEG